MSQESCEAERHSGHILRLPLTNKYSDMKITFGNPDLVFNVHKIVVCSQSPVIAKALESPFQVRIALDLLI